MNFFLGIISMYIIFIFENDEEITKLRDAPLDAQIKEMSIKLIIKPTFDSAKSSLCRSRQKMLPLVPTTQTNTCVYICYVILHRPGFHSVLLGLPRSCQWSINCFKFQLNIIFHTTVINYLFPDFRDLGKRQIFFQSIQN